MAGPRAAVLHYEEGLGRRHVGRSHSIGAVVDEAVDVASSNTESRSCGGFAQEISSEAGSAVGLSDEQRSEPPMCLCQRACSLEVDEIGYVGASRIAPAVSCCVSSSRPAMTVVGSRVGPGYWANSRVTCA